MPATSNHPESSFQSSPVRIIILGWKVILSEMAWFLFNLLRRWEIRQLRQRLDQEFMLFDRLAAEPGPDSSADLDLSRRQIDFLRDEIVYLEKELGQTRKDYIRKRLGRWRLELTSQSPSDSGSPGNQ